MRQMTGSLAAIAAVVTWCQVIMRQDTALPCADTIVSEGRHAALYEELSLVLPPQHLLPASSTYRVEYASALA